MFSKKKIFLGFIMFFCLSFSLFFIIGKKSYGMNIDTVLKTSNYSYLSEAAKKYIMQVYEETGEILLTEKNKEDNVPYLNPEYVKYLDYVYSGIIDDNITYDVIPNETVVDYVISEVAYLSEDIPSKFDLRNVGGKNYVTPIKNQESTGLCWAFATNAQAESHLLVKNNLSYEVGVSNLFSEMQLDYALADNGIIDGEPIYSRNRILGDGGTFNYIVDVAKDGLAFVDSSWRDFDDYDSLPMEKNKIYNYSNSKYDLLSTVNYPKANLGELDLTASVNVEFRENYLNNFKRLIMENGGAYVSTSDPISRCSISVNGYRLMYDDDKCASGGHAMQVIGWDDNFSYSFCSGLKDSSHYYYLGNSSNCNGGTVISGKGAWLLKNSWGTTQPYVYLAYDSMNTEFNLITEMGVKNWDNNHMLSYTGNYSSKVIASYKKKTLVNENLSMVKFNVTEQNDTYNVCYVNSTNNVRDCEDVMVLFPGLYSIDFSSKGYLVNNDSKIEITSPSKVMISSLYMYTSNGGDIVEIETEDVEYKNMLTNIDKYQFRISSKTVNVPENSKIDYKILELDGREINVNYIYSENTVFANNVFSKLLIDKELSKGEYILQTIYNGKVLYESSLIINNNVITIDGKGTEDAPYIINTPSQLNLVRLDNYAFYILGQDIDLTYDTQNENGLFYNDGKGWEPIKYSSYNVSNGSSFKSLYFSDGFSGGFDGNNHKIIGLYINRPEDDAVGLFSNTYNENFSNLHIKNLILEEPYVVGRNWVGSLIGYAYGTTYERNMDISNVFVIGGYVCGNDYVGGIIGYLNAGSHLKKYGTSYERHNISNLYNSAFIDAGNYGGGIFGMITNISGYTQDKSPIRIFNVLNKGPVMSYGKTGGLVGLVGARDINNIYIYNSINTGQIVGDVVASNIIGEFSDKSNGDLYLDNIYYLNDEEINFFNSNIKINNVAKKSFDELKNKDSYSKWNSFDTNWKIEMIDGITRFPVLKNIDFKYLSIDLIDIEVGKSVNISDYINPKIDAALYNDYIIEDDSIAAIDDDGLISGLKIGNTKMKVFSYYDGSVFDVSINVIGDKIKRTITFESNGGSEVKSITGEIDSEVLEPETPIRDKYKFVGWYLDNETFENKYKFTVMPEEDIVLYAKWEKLKKTIIFESNGGSEVKSITGEVDSVILEPDIPVREGYDFVGWYLDNETFENKYEFSLMPEEDIVLYAKWNQMIVKIKNYNNVDGKILDIKVCTAFKDYLDNFEYSDKLKVEFYKNDEIVTDLDVCVTTGSVIKFHDGSKLISEYVNVVSGDVDGDGQLTLQDIMKFARYIYINKSDLTGEYLLASDYNKDGNYNLQDIMKMAYDLYIK